MGLRDLQQDLQQHLLGAPSTVLDAIIDAPPLPASQRLAIYANAYEARLLESLDETYPVLHQVLGDEDFATLARLFIAAHPSVHRSIRWYGREVVHFLERTEPFSGQPIFAELALLEWSLAEVFDAADADPLSRDALAHVAAEDWAALTFEFHPALSRLALRFNTAAVWHAMTRDEEPPEPAALPATSLCLIWRRDLKSYFRTVPVPEATALQAALAGEDFAAICAALTGEIPETDIPLAAAQFLAGWLDTGIITALR